MAKSALITLGNEESYGLAFVAGELLENGQEIKFFDGDDVNWLDIVRWKPDYVMFSPLAVFFKKALRLAKSIKRSNPKIKTVFGGHHIVADASALKNTQIDIVVKGPVRGSIPLILEDEKRVIAIAPTTPDDMPRPARTEYYRDIPRAGKRYRKFVLSMLGCPWDCSYCSSSSGHIKEIFGKEAHRKYYMKRRPISAVIKEIEEIMEYDTHEIDWVDDDVFTGDENWMLEFINYVPVPMYVSSCSISILKTSDKLLRAMRECVNVVGMGVQAIRPESLRLFNRQWDNEGKMKAAYDRLTSFGYKVNMQCIVGLPIDDPIEDALETIMGMQRIGRGSICSCYPLMVYPGTQMEKICEERGIGLNEDCNGDTNSGICNIAFDKEVQRQLRNICKLATLFVKYGVDERWMRAMIKMDFDMKTSQELSMLRYRECVIDRLGGEGERIFNDILGSMKLRF